jgi:hypothetical protein
MRKKIFLFELCMIFLSLSLSGQEIYHLSYRSPNNPSISNISALLVKFGDNEGFIRLKYLDSASQKPVVINMQILEAADMPDEIMADSNLLVLRSINPRTVIGQNETAFQPGIFLFRKDEATGSFAPWKTGYLDREGKMIVAEFSSAPVLLKESDLNAVLLDNYFNPDEALYQNYTKTKSRGNYSWRVIPTLFLLVAADINDTQIGKGCGEDLKRLTQLYTLIARKLNIRIHTDTLMGDSYSKNNIERALKAINPDTNDIVVFHYTGHGYNRKDTKDSFPNLVLLTKQDRLKGLYKPDAQSTLSIQDIYNTIVKKKARLNLVFGDCCNDDYPPENQKVSADSKGRGIFTLHPDYCKTLFIDQKLSILTVATARGEQAANNDSYSLFTDSYLQILSKFLTPLYDPVEAEVSWESILNSNKTLTNQRARRTFNRTTNARFFMNPLIKITPASAAQ